MWAQKVMMKSGRLEKIAENVLGHTLCVCLCVYIYVCVRLCVYIYICMGVFFSLCVFVRLAQIFPACLLDEYTIIEGVHFHFLIHKTALHTTQ